VRNTGLTEFYWTHLLIAAAKGQLGHADAGDELARIFELHADFSAQAELHKWNISAENRVSILAGLRKAGLDC